MGHHCKNGEKPTAYYASNKKQMISLCCKYCIITKLPILGWNPITLSCIPILSCAKNKSDEEVPSSLLSLVVMNSAHDLTISH